jgi:hypothetical protein
MKTVDKQPVKAPPKRKLATRRKGKKEEEEDEETCTEDEQPCDEEDDEETREKKEKKKKPKQEKKAKREIHESAEGTKRASQLVKHETTEGTTQRASEFVAAPFANQSTSPVSSPSITAIAGALVSYLNYQIEKDQTQEIQKKKRQEERQHEKDRAEHDEFLLMKMRCEMLLNLQQHKCGHL